MAWLAIIRLARGTKLRLHGMRKAEYGSLVAFKINLAELAAL